MIVKILFIFLNVCALVTAFGVSLNKDKKGTQYRENLFTAAVVTFINDATLAFLLSLIGHYSLGAICVVLAVEIAAGIVFVWKTERYVYLGDAVWRLTRGGNYIFLIVLVAAGILYCAYPTYHMWAGRDPSIYLLNGVSIARTGSGQLPDNQVVDEAYEEVQDFVELAYTGIYSDYEEGDSEIPSRVTSQFLHYFSAVLAIGYSLAGMEGLVRVNALVGILCLLTIYYLGKSIVNKEVGLIAAVLLAFNPAQLWSSRITQTELLYQLYVFFGLYLFIKAWREDRVSYALAAGGLFAGIGLNRLDSYIIGAGVFAFTCYVNLWIRERRRISMFLSGAYAAVSIVSMGYSYIYSRYYTVSQSGFKAVVILNLVLGVCVILACLLGKSRRVERSAFISTAMDDKRIRSVIFAVGVLLCILCYFWRPTLQSGLDVDRDFDKRALVEFCWYISAFALPFFFYGLWKIAEDKEKRRELLLLLAIGFSNLLVYIVRPSITPDHLWASRRWISVAYPFVLIVVAIGVQALPTVIKAGRITCNPPKVMVTALLTGYALYQCQLFLTVSMMEELPAQYEEVAGHMDTGKLYLARNSQMASVLRFVYGKDVVLMKEDSQAELYRYLAEERKAVHYIGEIEVLQTRFYYELLTKAEIAGTYVEETIGEYPTELNEVGGSADIYLVKAVDVAAADEGVDGWATRRIDLEALKFFRSVTRSGGGRCSSSAEGTFMYGPYWTMRAGYYALEVDMELVEQGDMDVFGLLEVTTDAGENLVSQCLIDISDFEEGQATFYLPFFLAEDAEKVEFRIRKKEGCVLEVTQVRYCLQAADGGESFMTVDS